MTTPQWTPQDEIDMPSRSVEGIYPGPHATAPARRTSTCTRIFLQANRWIGFLALVGTLGLAAVAQADADVPPGLQAELIGKLASFDRNLPARASGTVRVLVLHKNNDGRSSRIAKEVAVSLQGLSDIAGLPKEVRTQAFSSAAEVASLCKSQRFSIVYLAPGLDSEMTALAQALDGVDIMSVGPSGAVVGFKLEESKPRILINLTRAKSQHVALKAQVLKLARIVE